MFWYCISYAGVPGARAPGRHTLPDFPPLLGPHPGPPKRVPGSTTQRQERRNSAQDDPRWPQDGRRAPRRPPRRPKKVPKCSLRAPRMPKIGPFLPETVHFQHTRFFGLNSVLQRPRRPKRPPRSPQDGPRGPQERPNTAQQSPKIVQEAPLTASDGPKRGNATSHSEPSAPSGPPRPPAVPQEAQKRPQ